MTPIFILVFLAFCQGLYEDQVGKIDWIQKYIGKVDKSTFHSKYLVSISKGNILSSIDINDGKLLWRHSYEDHNKIMDLCLTKKMAITLSSFGGIIRTWDIKTGSIIYETSVSEEHIHNGTLNCLDESVLFTHAKGSGILNVENDEFNLKKFNTGFKSVSSHFTDKFSKPVLIGITTNGECSVFENDKITPAKNECQYSKHYKEFAFKIENKSLKILDSIKKTELSYSIEGDSKELGELSQDSLSLVTSDSIKLYSYKNKLNLFGSTPKSDFHRIFNYDGNEYLLSLDHDVKKSFKNTKLSLYSLSMDKVEKISETESHIAGHHGVIQDILPLVDESTFGRVEDILKVFIRCSDYSIAVYNAKGKKIWIREEALGHVVGTEFADLPVSELQAFIEDEFEANANIFDMFLRRIKAQYHQSLVFIRSCFGSLLDNSNQAHHLHQENSNTKDFISYPKEVEDLNLSRENFNLNKILILVTENGKVFGLKSQTGSLVWTFRIPNASPLSGYGETRIFNQRTSSHHTIPPITTILMYHNVEKNKILVSFNPITGRPFDLEKTGKPQGPIEESIPFYLLPFKPIQIMLYPGMVLSADEDQSNSDIPFKDTQYVRPLVILSDDLKVYIYPSKTSNILKNSHMVHGPLFFNTIERETSQIVGYRVFMSKIFNGPIGKFYEAKMIWNLNLNSPTSPQVIVSTSAKIPQEKVHSIGRVLADRSVLYKYLNPNLIAVITKSKDISNGLIPAQNPNSNITVYIIDSVVGSILHSASHQKCGDPLSVLISENWVIYSFYNHKTLRTEIVLLELFEQKSRNDQLDTWALFLRALTHTQGNRENQTLNNINRETSPEASNNKQQNLVEKIEDYDNTDLFTFSSIYRDTSGRKFSEDGKSSEPIQSLIPVVSSKAYLLSGLLMNDSFAVTLTEKGITSKSVLMSMKNGGLIEIPLSWLDPSINMEMSPEAISDVYQPEIPLTTLNYINYNQTLFGVKKVKTAPSGLESTSLVFSYGLDLFHTRIAPSKTFDLLKEDFDYFFISAVTLGMLVGSLITYRLASRKIAMKAWA